MRLTVFGASGGVGWKVVTYALERGHAVRAVYRTPPDLSPRPGLETLVTDDIRNEVFLHDALRGADAVVSAVGIRRKNPRNPWSPLISPPDLATRFAERLIRAMREGDCPRRVVAVSAAGVGDSRPQVSAPFRFLIRRSNIGLAYRDLEGMETQFETSGLDWICVRPTTLTDGLLTQQVQEATFFRLTSRISRSDVAWYVLQCLERPESSSGRIPMITGVV
jgi:uncharacterized protein YbjT (DUF2867 family)